MIDKSRRSIALTGDANNVKEVGEGLVSFVLLCDREQPDGSLRHDTIECIGLNTNIQVVDGDRISVTGFVSFPLHGGEPNVWVSTLNQRRDNEL